MSYKHLSLTQNGSTARVTMERREVRNALNAELIAEVRDVFEQLATQPEVRAIVLAGAGPMFSAGADVTWMQRSLLFTEQENVADAMELAAMFSAIDRCPKPTIARVQGAALGGGIGLIAACDIVIAEEGAKFGLTEIKLGIVPAVISPFVLRKMAHGAARTLMITGERFSAERAREIGLVTQVVAADKLDEAIEAALAELASCSPAAVGVVKEIWRTVPTVGDDEARDYTTRTIARMRVSPEGQEGLRAFLEKRKPAWKGDL